ncbi:MAG: YceD family protein [Dehalococcoidia bacterium]
MLFNVAQLLQEPVGAERVYDVSASIPGVADDAPPTDVAGGVRLVRTNRGLLAYAALDAIARDICGRCLQPTETPLHVTLEEEFLPTVDVNTGQAVPHAEEDAEAFRIDEHHHLDLTEAVRQALVMQQPMQPLCRPDCKGLCARCGADLNAGPCGCPKEPVDERWAALRGLHVNEN